jgi:hypothetical protein
MKSITGYIYPIFYAALLLAAAGCTDNPLESDSVVTSSRRRIHGAVRLSDRADHSGVYIWMEGFNLRTVSRTDGAFSFTLPLADAQGAAGGTDGVFRLHAFLGNYRMASVTTAVRDGAFLFPDTEIDENGNIREELFLQELFSITTTTNLSAIEADSLRVLFVEVKLRTTVPPVEVYFPRMVNGLESPLLIRDVTTNEVRILETTVTDVEMTDYVQVGVTGYTRSMILVIPSYTLQAGEYEIVPFLLPRERSIPLGLLASLGSGVSTLGREYLDYPFIRAGGRFRVYSN